MNWRRILIFIAAFFAATAATLGPFGFIATMVTPPGEPIPPWVPAAQGGANLLVGTIVFAALARRQLDRTWKHAWAVWAGSQAASFPLSVGVLGMAFSAWLGGAIALLLPVLVGVPLGQTLYRRTVN